MLDDQPAAGEAHVLLDAARLVQLLADDHRRRVVAALVLGAAADREVAAATGLTTRDAWRAVNSLEAAGLVERGTDGTLVLLESAFARAARDTAPAQAAIAEPPDADRERARVLRAFVKDGRLLAIPAQRGKRLVLLELLAQEFEPGRRYSEKMVNLVLGRWHPDTAALRRYLVDEGFLSRESGEYWRTGGPVDL
jgi:hypothetical protein